MHKTKRIKPNILPCWVHQVVMDVLSWVKHFLMKLPPVPMILWLVLFPFHPEMEEPKYFVFQWMLLLVLVAVVTVVLGHYVLNIVQTMLQ
jgi:hypothetical protein